MKMKMSEAKNKKRYIGEIKNMIRAEVTIFKDRDSDLPEDEARDNLISILDAYGIDVTRVKFQEIKKDEKRLWKFKLTYFLNTLLQEDFSEVRELTTDEAINWLDEYIKRKPRDYNFTGLYYKKDGEWVLYEKNKVNKNRRESGKRSMSKKKRNFPRNSLL